MTEVQQRIDGIEVFKPGDGASRDDRSWVRARIDTLLHGTIVLSRRPRVVAIAGASVVVLFGAFTLLWGTTCQLVDARLAGSRSNIRSGVYAAPLVLRGGQPLAPADLVQYLEELGYGAGSAAESDGLAGRYLVEGDVVHIEPLEATSSLANRPRSVDVEFAGDRGIKRLSDPTTHSTLEQVALEPLVIASAYNKREKRIAVEYDAIPVLLRNAIVTTEDRRFWSHNGVDYRGIARAAGKNLEEGEIVQGGSTITQQVVKNVFLSPERTVLRKVREAWVSWVLEWKLDKKQIFTLYFNEVYLGQKGRYAIHGFAEAARQYFDKDLADLNLSESALLAGIVCAPSANSPYRYPDRAMARRNLVIDLLVEANAVQPDEAESAKAAPISVVPTSTDASWLDAPYFSDYVQTYVEQGFEDGHAPQDRYAVDTTIDINLQRAATAAMTKQLEKLDAVFAKGRRHIPPGTLQAALVAMDPKTGEVLAMVGGRDYATSQFNRVTDAERQPGSAFKPFVYATALESHRFTAASLLMDAPCTFTYGGGQVYEPENYGQSYANTEIPVRVAFRNSKNVPTVELAVQVGLASVARTAEWAGLPRPEPYPSMALGVMEATPLEIARAYTVFANNGVLVEPTPVARTEGAIHLPRSRPRKVLSPQTAYVMTNLMQDVIARGTGRGVRALGVSGAVAGKTGTSRDGWFVGYTPNLVCVVWVGFDDNSQLGLTGAESALPIWADFMKQAVAFRPELGGDRFDVPDGITRCEICGVSGARASSYCTDAYDELFIGITAPQFECTLHNGAEQTGALYDEFGNPIGGDEAIVTEAEPEDTGEPPANSSPPALSPLALPATPP